MPKGVEVTQEINQPGAEYDDERDVLGRIDYTFFTGDKAGQTVKDRWIYFQDGCVVKNFKEPDDQIVLGCYTTNNDVAATLSKFGNGWVDTIGLHPEADDSWFESVGIDAPDGLQYDIGWDVIEATMLGAYGEKQAASNSSTSQQPSSTSSTSDPTTAEQSGSSQCSSSTIWFLGALYLTVLALW
ncbi:uncharacterized protein RCC_06183 [Ramularia collo-cygni]|uniref:Uncharacterized protein n=1 Tax=Ramularia collo-cygni TaxID=112498 RepID=A0A2D3VC64_9PEZI|nr:uncharacterized protein RCC_06183 [Ramularia collo-cygni]CZT20324.1 uncharacterized protein RCC_06183 [Ramularia collo-cygni]